MDRQWDLRIGVKEDVLADRSYHDFADFLIALPLIELKIARVSSIQHDAFGIFIFRAPVVECLQQLLAQLLTGFCP